jgi:MoaA/NifB/PqqE/SkfB family radical SAM enzyme
MPNSAIKKYYLPVLKISDKTKFNNFDILLDADEIRSPLHWQAICRTLEKIGANIRIGLINFPPCCLDVSRHEYVIFSDPYKYSRRPQCKKCHFCFICSGLPPVFPDEISAGHTLPIPDLPAEVMIEIEPACNFNCEFCFNKLSFAKEKRAIKRFSAGYVKKIINGIASAGIKAVRFTGGEPLLREDIFILFEYAKNKGLEVRLNTNCSLINDRNINKFRGIVDNILIPLESGNAENEAKATKFPSALKRKIGAIKLLKKIEIPVVRVGTVATPKIISDLVSMAGKILKLPIDDWELYRPITDSRDIPSLGQSDLNMLVKNLSFIEQRFKRVFKLANALPFCAIDEPWKLDYFSEGARHEDGHSRIVIDPRGFVKPHYFIDKNIGDPLDILSAWHHPFMKRMRTLRFLPVECRLCFYRYKCRGGSRFEAKNVFGHYSSLDRLARPDIIKINRKPNAKS